MWRKWKRLLLRRLELQQEEQYASVEAEVVAARAAVRIERGRQLISACRAYEAAAAAADAERLRQAAVDSPRQQAVAFRLRREAQAVEQAVHRLRQPAVDRLRHAVAERLGAEAADADRRRQ